MKVAIDQDDTAADFIGQVRDAIFRETGVHVPAPTTWDASTVFNPALGENWWAWLERRPHVWANMKAVPGFINAVERLQRGGHDVELLTTKPEWAVPLVYDWLARWRVPIRRVTIVPFTPHGSPHVSKTEFTDADVLVDDRFENVADFVAAGRYGVLFDRPHNRAFGVKNRAADWHDVLRIIERWSK